MHALLAVHVLYFVCVVLCARPLFDRHTVLPEALSTDETETRARLTLERNFMALKCCLTIGQMFTTRRLLDVPQCNFSPRKEILVEVGKIKRY